MGEMVASVELENATDRENAREGLRYAQPCPWGRICGHLIAYFPWSKPVG